MDSADPAWNPADRAPHLVGRPEEQWAQVVREGVHAMAPAGRDGGWFGAEVPVPAEARVFARALAASGRDPGRTP